MDQLSLIITMHNDADKIRNTIQQTQDFLKLNNIDAEIIIAEDGSTDGTDQIAKEIASTNPSIYHLHADQKLGKGLAIERATKFAHNNLVMFMDSDLSTDLSGIPRLIQAIKDGASIAVGSRGHPQSQVERDSKRDLFSHAFNAIVQFLFGIKIRDMQCGFKAFLKKDVTPLFELIKQKKWAWDTELLVLATKIGLTITEIPITWREAGDTKVKILHNTKEHIKGLVQLKWRLLFEKTLKVSLINLQAQRANEPPKTGLPQNIDASGQPAPTKGLMIGGFQINKEFILKFIRFCIAGAISYFVQIGLTFLILLFLPDELIATTVGILLTQFFHFWLSKDFAFRYKDKARVTQFFYFLATRFASILIQIVVTDLAFELFNINIFIGQLMGIMVSMLFNFVTSNWLIFVEPKTLKEAEQKARQVQITTYVLLFLTAIFVGLLTVNNESPIISSDNLHMLLNGQVIIGNGGLPLFKWTHTPLYKYLIMLVIVVFKDTTFYLRLVQVVIYAMSVCMVYATICLKKSRKIALTAAIFYMFSYFSLFAANDVHEEALVVIFIAASYYFAFAYEKERKPLLFWCYAASVGLAFFTKETVMIVLVIYMIYMVFWVKPPKKDLIVAVGILGLFFAAFMFVELLQDWWIIWNYLGIGQPGADTFLSQSGVDFSKLLTAFAVEPVIFGLALINVAIKLIKIFKRKAVNSDKTSKRIGSDQVVAISILIFLGFYVISRSRLFHLIYITLLTTYFAAECCFKLVDFFQSKAPKFAALYRRNPKKAVAVVLLPLLTVHLLLFAPNLYSIRTRGDGIVQVYQEIGAYVGKNATYCEIHTGINYYIENLYSFNGNYNSYERHNFVFRNDSDNMYVTSWKNISDYGLKFFLYEEGLTDHNSFFYAITRNGSLSSVKNYTYRATGMWDAAWWEPVTYSTIELYTLL